jgi:hypothetical protein
LWSDPLTGAAGPLGGHDLAAYGELLGLIRPWRAQNLRPAALVLRVGAAYWADGELHELGEGEDAVIAPGAMAVVPPAEVVVMPHYLRGRFGPSVRTVHQGLVFGTALQVDPGYMGALSPPLHNPTADPVRLRRGAPFARLDLDRLVPPSPEVLARLAAVRSEDELYAAAAAGELAHDGRAYALFERANRWRDPLRHPRYLSAR